MTLNILYAISMAKWNGKFPGKIKLQHHSAYGNWRNLNNLSNFTDQEWFQLWKVEKAASNSSKPLISQFIRVLEDFFRFQPKKIHIESQIMAGFV